jgi:hypothetical protein
MTVKVANAHDKTPLDYYTQKQENVKVKKEQTQEIGYQATA